MEEDVRSPSEKRLAPWKNLRFFSGPGSAIKTLNLGENVKLIAKVELASVEVAGINEINFQKGKSFCSKNFHEIPQFGNTFIVVYFIVNHDVLFDRFISLLPMCIVTLKVL